MAGGGVGVDHRVLAQRRGNQNTPLRAADRAFREYQAFADDLQLINKVIDAAAKHGGIHDH